MSKEEVIKLLNECLSSNKKLNNKEQYQELINLLENIKKNIKLLKNINVEDLSAICKITDEEKQDIRFYKLLCELDDSMFGLTNEQVAVVNELIDKYLKIIIKELNLINKEAEKDNYLREIVEKVKQDKFVLNYEELSYINKTLKDKKVDISQINQIIMGLSLMVIQTLEEKLMNRQSNVITIENNQELSDNTLETDDKKITSDKELSDDEYIYELDNILYKYGCLKYHDNLVKKIEVIRNRTTLKDIEVILEIIVGMKTAVSDNIFVKLIFNSSKKVIDNVLNIYMKLTGFDKEHSFKNLYRHVSIFMKDGENSSYQDFMKNMYMLEELKVTPEEFLLMDTEVLCINHNRLKRNILILEKYQIPRECYLKSVTVLKSPKNFSDELDMWVELGNGEAWAYLKNSLSVLVSNPIKDFRNKFRILRDLGINITINDKYKSLKKELFRDLDLISNNGNVTLNNIQYHVEFVPHKVDVPEYDELMNKKLIDFQKDKTNESELYNKFISNTECVKNSYYIIPGINIRISKNKVYRVFNNLLNSGVKEGRDMLIYAITYNSAITLEEYNNICNYVDQLLGNTLEQKGSVR